MENSSDTPARWRELAYTATSCLCEKIAKRANGAVGLINRWKDLVGCRQFQLAIYGQPCEKTEHPKLAKAATWRPSTRRAAAHPEKEWAATTATRRACCRASRTRRSPSTKMWWARSRSTRRRNRACSSTSPSRRRNWRGPRRCRRRRRRRTRRLRKDIDGRDQHAGRRPPSRGAAPATATGCWAASGRRTTAYEVRMREQLG